MGTLRIARIITRLNVGGPAYQATLLNHLLPDLGYDSLLIHGTVPPGEVFFGRLLDQYPGKVRQVPHMSRAIAPAADAAALLELVRVLRDFRPDIVHTHTAKAGMLGRLAGKLSGAKAIVHTYHGHVLEGYFQGPMAKVILHSERFLARFTNRLVCISPRLTTELAERFQIAPVGKFATIELGLPLDRFAQLPPRGSWRSRLNVPAETLVLGSLGRLAPIKNYDRMLRAFAGLAGRSTGRDLCLWIGGTGPLEAELKKTAQELGIEDRVRFLGLVEDLPQFYADIDIAVLTSDNEGTPVTMLEAQAAGKYCVAPDVGGIGDVLYPAASTLVRPNEPAAYVAALGEVIEHWDEHKEAAETIRTAVIERFSPRRLVRDLDELYRQLLKGSP